MSREGKNFDHHFFCIQRTGREVFQQSKWHSSGKMSPPLPPLVFLILYLLLHLFNFLLLPLFRSAGDLVVSPVGK
jgi:hypothetical protein